MKLASLLLLAILWTGSTAHAADCEGVFLFRANDRLSIQELSRLVAETNQGEGPNNTLLVAQTTDPIPSCRAGFTFRLDGQGVLYAGGQRVGQAKAGE